LGVHVGGCAGEFENLVVAGAGKQGKKAAGKTDNEE